MRLFEFTTTLLEYNQQLTVQNFGDKVIDRFRTEPESAWNRMLMDKSKSSIPEYREDYKDHLIKEFEKIDPTPHKEYVQWLCRTYVNALGVVTKLEDFMSRGADTLARFQKLKVKQQLKPEHRDINRFKSLQDFEQVVASYPEVEEQNVDKGQANLILDNTNLRVIQPLDEAAAKYYGQGTKWCTAAKNNNMFNSYNKRGPLYIIIPKVSSYLGEKYQFCFEANQFMNEKDEYIADSTMFNWTYIIKRFPELSSLFENQAAKNICIPLMKNGQAVLDKWDMIMEHVGYEVKLRLPNIIPGVMKVVKKDLWSEANASDQEASMVARSTGYAMKDDADGLMQVFTSRITAHNIGDEDTLHDDIMMDSLAGWISDNEHITDAIEWSTDRNKEFEEYGCHMAIAYAIGTPILKLFKQLAAQSIPDIGDEDM